MDPATKVGPREGPGFGPLVFLKMTTVASPAQSHIIQAAVLNEIESLSDVSTVDCIENGFSAWCSKRPASVGPTYKREGFTVSVH